jgi:hypothetical protein
VGVKVAVDVAVDVGVAVGVDVAVAVSVAVGVLVGVSDCVAVGLEVGVTVGGDVAMLVNTIPVVGALVGRAVPSGSRVGRIVSVGVTAGSRVPRAVDVACTTTIPVLVSTMVVGALVRGVCEGGTLADVEAGWVLSGWVADSSWVDVEVAGVLCGGRTEVSSVAGAPSIDVERGVDALAAVEAVGVTTSVSTIPSAAGV